METIIVVIMLIFLILLGALYYAAIAKDSLDRITTGARLSQLEKLSKKMHYMPELSCTNYGAAKTPCIDIYKAKIFGNMLVKEPTSPPVPIADLDDAKEEFEELRLGYYPLFGDSLVKLMILYPNDMKIAEGNITLYNASKSGDVQTRAVPVAIRNPLTGVTALGLLYTETD